MTNGQYPPGLLGHQGLQHSPATPVIRTMDMSNTNNRTIENTSNYQQTLSNSPSPRDGNSPPGLHVPNGHGSHSSKVNIFLSLAAFCQIYSNHIISNHSDCQDHSPVDSPHSLSPPAPQHVVMRQGIHLQPSHHISGSPQKEPTYSVTPLTTMSVPGFPPPVGSFTTVSRISLIRPLDSWF